jgi:predicted nucleic-acid-binding protein
MKALDTNVLVRFLVRDDKQQAKAVYRKLKQTETDREVLFIPLLVVPETILVLESVYGVARQEILDSLDQLLLMPILEFEGQSAFRSFVFSAQQSKTDLSGLLIAHSAKFAGCMCVITCDRKASNPGLFELLK